jgi:hypothetical protein
MFILYTQYANTSFNGFDLLCLRVLFSTFCDLNLEIKYGKILVSIPLQQTEAGCVIC